MRGYRWVDDDAAMEAMKKKVPQNMHDCFAMIERHMFEGPWVLGDRFSICDPYLYTVASWMESDGVDRSDFPKVADHYARMSADPIVRKVLAAQNAA